MGVGWRGVGGEATRRVGWPGFKPWLRICCGEVRKARQRWEGASAAARKGNGEGEALAGGSYSPKARASQWGAGVRAADLMVGATWRASKAAGR